MTPTEQDIATLLERVDELSKQLEQVHAQWRQQALSDLNFYFPDTEPGLVALGDDCVVEIDEDYGSLVATEAGERRAMPEEEFFADVECGLARLREIWGTKSAGVSVHEDHG